MMTIVIAVIGVGSFIAFLVRRNARLRAEEE
jgi:hypothetical protein